MSSPAESVPASGRLPMTVLIRTLNEADRIGQALEAVQPLADEILVLDAGSTDETVAIAERYGARVVHNPWPGFGPQRRYGESLCTYDMVFSLDADEVVTPKFIDEVRRAFQRDPVPRLMIVGKASVHPYWRRPSPLAYAATQVLIYDRRIASTIPNPNWDKLEITSDETPLRIREPLWHFSTRDLKHAMNKATYVAHLAATTSKPRKNGELILRVVTELPFAFLKYYFLRRYCLAGLDGFVLSVVGAYGRWQRVAMMLEQNRKDQVRG